MLGRRNSDMHDVGREQTQNTALSRRPACDPPVGDGSQRAGLGLDPTSSVGRGWSSCRRRYVFRRAIGSTNTGLATLVHECLYRPGGFRRELAGRINRGTQATWAVALVRATPGSSTSNSAVPIGCALNLLLYRYSPPRADECDNRLQPITGRKNKSDSNEA